MKCKEITQLAEIVLQDGPGNGFETGESEGITQLELGALD
jgi:hypothetical protein